MNRQMTRTCTALAVAAVLAAGGRGLAANGPGLRPAADLITAAVLERVGSDADVSLTNLDIPGSIAAFRGARPDPDGRIDRPMRFTLVTDGGASIAAVVSVHVSVDHAVT